MNVELLENLSLQILTDIARVTTTGETVECINAMHLGRTCDLNAVIYVDLTVDPCEPCLASTGVVAEEVTAYSVVLTWVGAAFI